MKLSIQTFFVYYVLTGLTHIVGMRKIYAEYGWPDVEKYRKEECIQALKLWYKDLQARQQER
jgi:hypothetical protein